MKRMTLKNTAIVLVLAMLFCVIPVSSIEPDPIESRVPTETTSIDKVSGDALVQKDDQNTAKNRKINQEDVSLRSENVKHFYLGDGQYNAIIYSNPVHRMDENGVWQDIDNRLIFNSDKLNTYSTSDGRVSFSDSVTDNSLWTFRENGYSISMGLISEQRDNAKASKAIINNHLTRDAQMKAIDAHVNSEDLREPFTQVDNKTTVQYQGIASGVNLEYILDSNEIKEYIIVDMPQNEYIYSFALNLDGLCAEMMEGGAICLKDVESGEVPYYIPSPYMIDANGVMGTDVKYMLEEIEKGQYLLTVVADSAWFDDSSRAFPVKIDPTIQLPTFDATYISSANPTKNYGGYQQLWISSGNIVF